MTEPMKKKKGRSPSYPAIPLSQAIERARKLWDQEKQYPTAVDTIIKHWGYSTMNGPASLTLAALLKFGLIEDEGVSAARKAWITVLAVNILANPDENEQRKSIQIAALKPSIHSELWQKYGQQLPSVASLKWELTQGRKFTDRGAEEFIREYQETIAFAQLTTDGTIDTQDLDSRENEDDVVDQLLPEKKNLRRRQMTNDGADVLTIPLLGGRPPILIEGVNQISEQNWDQFMAILNVMKPSLIQAEPDETENA